MYRYRRLGGTVAKWLSNYDMNIGHRFYERRIDRPCLSTLGIIFAVKYDRLQSLQAGKLNLKILYITVWAQTDISTERKTHDRWSEMSVDSR